MKINELNKLRRMLDYHFNFNSLVFPLIVRNDKGKLIKFECSDFINIELIYDEDTLTCITINDEYNCSYSIIIEYVNNRLSNFKLSVIEGDIKELLSNQSVINFIKSYDNGNIKEIMDDIKFDENGNLISFYDDSFRISYKNNSICKIEDECMDYVYEFDENGRVIHCIESEIYDQIFKYFQDSEDVMYYRFQEKDENSTIISSCEYYFNEQGEVIKNTCYYPEEE